VGFVTQLQKLVLETTLEALKTEVGTRALAMKLAGAGDRVRRQFLRLIIKRAEVGPSLIRLQFDGTNCHLFGQPVRVICGGGCGPGCYDNQHTQDRIGYGCSKERTRPHALISTLNILCLQLLHVGDPFGWFGRFSARPRKGRGTKSSGDVLARAP